jgi:two-component system NtrC family response regulator
VILIAKALLEREVAHFRKKNQIRGFSRETYDALTAHPWPGNVRELGNRIKRAVLMANGPLVGAEEMGLTLQHPSLDKPAGLKEAKEQLEKDMIAAALRKSGGRIGLAAADLGISRQFLNDLVKKHQFYEYKKLLKVSR